MPREHARDRLSAVMSSSSTGGRDDWCTPAEVLDRVRRIAPIGLDPCSNPASIVRAAVEWALPLNGLSGRWAGRGLVFVNPPYGRDATGAWVEKAAREAGRGAEVVMLIPARTDTTWFHRRCVPLAPRSRPAGSAGDGHARALCFVDGRLDFLGDDSERAGESAPFPSLLVYFGARPERFRRAFDDFGAVWTAPAMERHDGR
jgi:hypothetical protein